MCVVICFRVGAGASRIESGTPESDEGSTDTRAPGDFRIAQGKQSSRSLEPTRLDVVHCDRVAESEADASSWAGSERLGFGRFEVGWF
jgi:hypothetical protein